MAQQDTTPADVAYIRGRRDAQMGREVAYGGDHYPQPGCAAAYARGWLDGSPTHSIAMARLLSRPIDND